MITNPYETANYKPRESQRDSGLNRKTSSGLAKCAWIVVGLTLYFSNVFRDAHFYRKILENEGFSSNEDSVAVGIAGSVLTTLAFAPVAMFVIGYGIGMSHRVQLAPRFDRFTYAWGIFASFLAIAMLSIEAGYLSYTIRYPHHWQTLCVSIVYIGFIYLWWCASLAHGKNRIE